jgi:hypothetical protein
MRSVALLVVVWLLLLPVFAAPAEAQTQPCSISKILASGRYLQARANCTAKGLAKGIDPESLCIAKALDKLGTSFGKAEAKGPCTSPADLSPAEDILADALDDAEEAVAQVIQSCCDGSNDVCTFEDPTECTDGGGTPGPPGSICQADGTCGSIPNASTGTCCDGIGELVPDFQASCVSGPDVVAACVGEGFPLVADASCHPELGCIDASLPLRSRCTSAKLKAVGRYFSSAAKCEATAVKKNLPVDLVCLGKAETKMSRAFLAAEKKDDCLGRDDYGDALTVLSAARILTVQLLNPELSVCCATAVACFYTETADDCFALVATPSEGEACNGDGTCSAPPLDEGGCCEGLVMDGVEKCAGGVTEPNCTGAGGTFVGDALCTTAQVCID